MISWVLVLARRIWTRLWVRVVLLSLCSLLSLAFAPLLTPFIPEGIKYQLGRDAILPVLTILASGMLAVTTFSLNVMVSAYRAASSMATPRAYRLLLEDTTTQSVLATFVGGFVYSLSAVILFHAQVYSDDAAVVVFGFTIVVVVLIVLAILRWIDHLSHLGSMDHTLQIIEAQARETLRNRARRPCLGARAATDDDILPVSARAFLARKSGYIRFIDMAKLNQLAQEAASDIHISCAPGDFVLRDTPLGMANMGDDRVLKTAARCFEIGDVRSFDQDPALGLVILAETAQRALSPGVNDPGTAVEVIGRLQRLLWEELPVPPNAEKDHKATFPRVSIAPVAVTTLLSAAFTAIARDGAQDPDVMTRLHGALAALADHPNTQMAAAAQDMQKALNQS